MCSCLCVLILKIKLPQIVSFDVWCVDVWLLWICHGITTIGGGWNKSTNLYQASIYHFRVFHEREEKKFISARQHVAQSLWNRFSWKLLPISSSSTMGSMPVCACAPLVALKWFFHFSRLECNINRNRYTHTPYICNAMEKMNNKNHSHTHKRIHGAHKRADSREMRAHAHSCSQFFEVNAFENWNWTDIFRFKVI